MQTLPQQQHTLVTLTVNCSNNFTVGPNGMYAGGGFLGGSDGLQLSDADGDGTWEGVATVTAGTGPNYYAFSTALHMAVIGELRRI